LAKTLPLDGKKVRAAPAKAGDGALKRQERTRRKSCPREGRERESRNRKDDMARGASARRYAQAVFGIALDQGEPDRWLDDLALLSDAMANEEFANFLDAPQLTLVQKTNLIGETLGDTVSDLARNLLSLLASRNSARLMPSITESYQQMLDEHNGVERAEIVAAVPLSSEQQQRIEAMLTGIVGKDIRATSRVEPQIIGGFVARVGDKVIDGSTRTRLDELRRELVHGA
jgi:F-type H+-transporting ATPase subunit delta